MRKVVVYELISLDGVAENPDQFITEWDDVMQAQLNRMIATQDDVVLGRRSYEEWARFWPTSDVQPFADFINGVDKHVVTSRPLDPPWSHATPVSGEPAEVVRRLRIEPGRDIGIHASLSVARSLLTAGVVTNLHLVVAPTVVGGGHLLLAGLPPMRLTLRESTTSPSGYLILDFDVAARSDELATVLPGADR